MDRYLKGMMSIPELSESEAHGRKREKGWKDWKEDRYQRSNIKSEDEEKRGWI